eukprot:Nitzschia sp. Nitz4//scaffold216_size36101//27008//28225//NITZ4_007784-RA/size36101-processed-gene-0.36-mRNA-1//1//CDS//3329542203//3691//frame0
MKFSIVALICSLSGVAAFVPIAPVSRSRLAFHLEAYPGKEHVVKNGGGISVVETGDCQLFDPKVAGLLGGTPDLADRLSFGASFPVETAAPAQPAVPQEGTVSAQAWLEDLGVPSPFAKNTKPVTATVLGRAKLISDDAPGDIQHVLLKLPEGMHYVEGQSISVIPPGVDAKTGKSHKPRLYSIASTRYGDLLDGNTVSLCVRRAQYKDPATGQIDDSKAGVCSNFLCNSEPGTTVQVAGPTGKTMLLPQDPNTDVIMVATGTGIAPFRSFLHRLFVENTPARHMFNGHAWLILGVPVTGGLLYPEELDAMKTTAGSQLDVTYAISREMQNKQGGKLYVQDVLSEQADVLFAKLQAGANIYFCGLKGMMPGILESLEKVATEKGLDWSKTLSHYKNNHQWHVEVY